MTVIDISSAKLRNQSKSALGDVEIGAPNREEKGHWVNGVFYTERSTLNAEALIYVGSVRRAKGGGKVTLDEVLAKPDPYRHEWTTPERREALETVLRWQKD